MRPTKGERSQDPSPSSHSRSYSRSRSWSSCSPRHSWTWSWSRSKSVSRSTTQSYHASSSRSRRKGKWMSQRQDSSLEGQLVGQISGVTSQESSPGLGKSPTCSVGASPVILVKKQEPMAKPNTQVPPAGITLIL